MNYGAEVLKNRSSYNIYSLGEKVTDPYTGEEIGYAENLIGSASVIDVKEKYSVIEITDSRFDVDVFMILRPKKSPKIMKNNKKKKGISLSL